MEFVKFGFAFFITLISLLSSETAAYGASRIRNDCKTLKDEIYFIRQNITTLFNELDQLNISAVDDCCPSISGNKTPVTNDDGRQDMVKVKGNNVLVKYHSLIKAFGTEKKINRELQDQLLSLADIISTSEKIANKRDRELQSRLLLMEENISVSERVAKKRDRELQSRLQSMEESMKNTISDIYQDIRNNMSSFMTMISEKIGEHFRKADTTSIKPDITTVPIIFTVCRAMSESGVYRFYSDLIMSTVTVYCDQDTDGGGWIVIMRRRDGSVHFTRSWSDYKLGFGSPHGEFWAGNELLHKLTKERPMKLRIDMEDFRGNTAYAMYEEFEVGAEEDKYRLHVSGYSGTAGDSLIDTVNSRLKHTGMQFSTFDSDNDKSHLNCAEVFKGGWWYNDCFVTNLNAPYIHDNHGGWADGFTWHTWPGYSKSLKRVEMKIR